MVIAEWNGHKARPSAFSSDISFPCDKALRVVIQRYEFSKVPEAHIIERSVSIIVYGLI